MEQALQIQSINAAIVNISGRQRMLSQRTAMFCLRLACSETPEERAMLRQQLQDLSQVMERSHRGLLEGDLELHLPGNPSPTVRAMYFEPPLNIDQRMRTYIKAVRVLINLPNETLTPQNPHLQDIIEAASTDLLAALDAVVSQYQQESEAEEQAIAAQQLELYRQSCLSAEAAQTQAAELQRTLAELHQTQAQLIQAEKMSSLGQLVGGIAHEINNPINFIHGNLKFLQQYGEELLQMVHLYQHHYPHPVPEIEDYAQLIDLEFLQTDLQKIIQSMRSGTDRIRQIVLSLRNFSRMDESDLKTVEIHEGIDNTLLILQHRLKQATQPPRSPNLDSLTNLSLAHFSFTDRSLATTTVSPNLEVSSSIEVIKDYGNLPLVECYPGQLNQCLMNILVNAIEALEEKIRNSNIQTTSNPFAPNQETIQRQPILALHNNGHRENSCENGHGNHGQGENNHRTKGHGKNGYGNHGHSQNGHGENGYGNHGHSENGHSQNGHSQNGHSYNGYIHHDYSHPDHHNQAKTQPLNQLKHSIQPSHFFRPQIRISTAIVDSDWVQIVIADNGPGIPETLQPHIFNPFFTTKPIGKGTGMGLSISYKIITETHHGRLDCYSSEGQGTTFIIQIPRRQDSPSTPSVPC